MNYFGTGNTDNFDFKHIDMNELTDTMKRLHIKKKRDQIVEVLKLYFPIKQTDCYYEMSADKIMEVLEDN